MVKPIIRYMITVEVYKLNYDMHCVSLTDKVVVSSGNTAIVSTLQPTESYCWVDSLGGVLSIERYD